MSGRRTSSATLVRVAQNPGRLAALVHRASGLALALFLPVHFLVLGTALERSRFDALISWSNQPFLKYSEWLLVTALAVHFAGGIRLLAIEMLETPPLRAGWIALAFAFALSTGLLFLMGAFLL